jgi:transposase
MSEIHLNKFEKEKRVIELHLAGKTIREIAKEVHISFRDISKLIKAYEKKVRLETKKEENNQQPTTKKLSSSKRIRG